MKENKIEKLILDLSTRWNCSPQEAVDRLNSMNESEINKLINSMTKKFQIGGRAFGPKIPYGNYMIIGTETEVLPKKSEVTQSQIDSVYNAEQDAFRKRAKQLIPELEQRNAETKQRLQNWQTVKANSPVQMPVTNSDPQYINRPRNFKFKNGGFIDCLRDGGSVEKCKCGCDKIAKAEDGKKVRRTDMPGYAYTLHNGIDVLTQDAVGTQPLPGSNYSIEGSSPEFETQRTTLTDKGGKPIAYNYNVYLNDDDHFFPIRRYTTQRLWYRPSTWLRTVLTPEAAAEKQAAYDANKLGEGGIISAAKGLSRKETLDILREDGGFGRATARTAYQQARRQLRQQTPLRGKDLRYQARENATREILNKKALSQLPVLDDFSNIEIKDEFPTVEVSSIAVDTTKPIIETMRVPTDTNVYTTAMSRQDAFADARKRGFKTYMWNGSKYNTMTKEEAEAKTKPAVSVTPTVAPTLETKTEPVVKTVTEDIPSKSASESAWKTAVLNGQLLDPNPIYTPPMEMSSTAKTKPVERTRVPSPKTSTVEYKLFGRIPELFSKIGYALRNPGSAQDRYEKYFKK